MALKNYNCSLKSIGEEGTGTAVFASLNKLDKDGDFTIPGAFGNQTAKLVGAHDWSAPSIGIARIHEEGDRAIADFRFNMEMPTAVEWYKALKYNFDAGLNTEWSYGFDVLKHSYRDVGGKQVRVLERMKVHEVSPVMVGAGIDTQTLSMKSCQSCGAKNHDDGQTLENHFEQVIAANRELLERVEQIVNLRDGQGRKQLTSQSTLIRFLKLKQQIRLLEKRIGTDDPDREELQKLFETSQRTLARTQVWLRR
jgi:hypothetical protein